MMKKIAGTVLAGIAAMMLTTTAFAGQFVGGYHLAVTDDCAGRVNAWGANDWPVEVDLGSNYATVKIYTGSGPMFYNFNRKSGPNQYMSDEGWTLDVNDCNTFTMVTYDGVDYICR